MAKTDYVFIEEYFRKVCEANHLMRKPQLCREADKTEKKIQTYKVAIPVLFLFKSRRTLLSFIRFSMFKLQLARRLKTFSPL